jgi:probable HAF family extracellular repeat protein
VVFLLSTPVAKAGYVFTTIDVPGAVGGIFQYGTHAVGITPAGQITGWYVANGQHGFVESSGVISTFDFPGVPYTHAYGTNAAGETVGWFLGNNTIDGFLDNGGIFTRFDNPGAPLISIIGTEATGINASGQIVGFFEDGSTPARKIQGFLDTNGTFTTIGPASTSNSNGDPLGINDAGQIVGSYFDSANAEHGFLYVNGIYTTIDAPGGVFTAASAINNSGQIVGRFCDGPVCHGYLDANGTFTTIDVPGAGSYTGALGINDAGQIVGEYTDGSGTAHGFLATPTPEPSSWLLVGGALIALATRSSILLTARLRLLS